MKTWKVLLLLLLCNHLVNSEDCLQCVYPACNDDVDLQLTESDTCCRCFQNIPENEPPPTTEECRMAFMDLRNQASFTVAECCDSARETLLQTYTPETASAAVCSTGYVFNDTSSLNLQPVDAHEYLIPSFTFSCQGCILQLQMLIDSTAIPNELTLHLWNSYKRGRDNTNLYERNESFPISITPEVTPRDGYSLISSAISTPVCFEPGDVFGFSLPPGSSVVVGPPGTDEVVGYKVAEPSHECDQNLLFQSSDETSLDGLPLIILKIGSEPVGPTSVTIPSSTFQVTPTTSPTGTGPTGPTGADDSGTGTPAPKKSFPLYIVIAAVLGAVIFILVVCIMVAFVIFTHKRRLKWKVASNGVVKHGPSTAAEGEERTKVRRTGSLSEITSVKLENMVNARECQNPFYDNPDELAALEMTPNSHLYHELTGPRDSVKNTHYETCDEATEATGKYLRMAPAGHAGTDPAGQASLDGWSTVKSIYADDFRPSQWESEFGDGYHDPVALDQFPPKVRPYTPDYDLPTELMKDEGKQQKAKAFYHVLDGRTPVKPDRYYHVLEESGSRHPPKTNTGHDYHELERRPPTSESSTDEGDGSVLRRSPSSYTNPVTLGVVAASNPMFAKGQSATPPHHYHMLDPNSAHTEDMDGRGSTGQPMVFECGIYVPDAEERKQLSESDRGEEGAAAITNWTNIKRRESSKRRGFFEQSESYWLPASKVTKLYDQFAQKKFREILREQIDITKYLGHGQFGTVARAKWSLPNESSIEVAVKMMKPSIAEDAKVKFLQEAAIMGQFSHSNVVKLHGVVTVGDPMMIVLELMSLGDLGTFLRKGHLPKRGKRAQLDPPTLLSFSRQVALGMKYLARKGFVHRDLAARNVLLNEKLCCKISDFGMSRDLADSNYYMSKGGNIPIKWTAPEALHYRKYSTYSDVYSYGMLLYELWSLGLKPLDSIPHTEIAGLTSEGYCQPPPPGCPREIYRLMVQCWNPSYNDRPSFPDIYNYLSATDRTLLLWTSEDKTFSMRVTELGAPLDESKGLYKDLQHTYRPE